MYVIKTCTSIASREAQLHSLSEKIFCNQLSPKPEFLIKINTYRKEVILSLPTRADTTQKHVIKI